MTVQNFIDEYLKRKNAQTQEMYLNGVIIKDKYVPFSDKIAIAERIANATIYTVVAEGTKLEKRIVKENTNARYMLYTLSLVDLYTNIDIEWDNKDNTTLQQFEALDAFDLIEMLVSLMPEMEVEKMQNILKATINDKLSYEMDLTRYLDTKIESVGLVFDKLLDVFATTIANNLSDVDVKELKKMFENNDTPIVPFDSKK